MLGHRAQTNGSRLSSGKYSDKQKEEEKGLTKTKSKKELKNKAKFQSSAVNSYLYKDDVDINLDEVDELLKEEPQKKESPAKMDVDELINQHLEEEKSKSPAKESADRDRDA